MTDPTVRLDEARPYSQCHGERTPEDPHYHVRFFQGGTLGKKRILLPFDAEHNLVPDDGKKEMWKGKDVEGKDVFYYPLWNDDMRKYLALKIKQLGEQAVVEEDTINEDARTIDHVNIEQWLRGQAKYDWADLVNKCRSQFGFNAVSKREMVFRLVMEEEVLKPDQLHSSLRSLLPAEDKAAA